MRDVNNEGPLRDAINRANPPLFPDFDSIQARLEAEAKANVSHTPRQRGPWIICTSCNPQHTLQWVGTNQSLVGINEEGGYVLKKRF